MINSSIGKVQLSQLSDDMLKTCEVLGIDANDLIRTTHFADFYCIMCALADEYGLETVLQKVTDNCEQLINERTDKHE